MNLQIHGSTVTGDLGAVCNAWQLLDERCIFDLWDALGPIDAPDKINTGHMVHLKGFTTEDGKTVVDTQQFQRCIYRD